MRKVIIPSPAVAEFEKVEASYTRAANSTLDPATRTWWIMYYKNRTAQIAAHHNMDEDDLVTAWLKWRIEIRLRDSEPLMQSLPR